MLNRDKVVAASRAARRTVTAYGRKNMGTYSTFQTVYSTGELGQESLTVRYGGHTAGNGAMARKGSRT
jgi:hypothetical protein